MFTGFSNIFKNINVRQKICKSVTMATQSSHHGALQYFPFFFTVGPVLFVCIFVQNKCNILVFMFLKELLYFDMSIKFDKFLAHLSRRLIGELIVYQWSGVRRPSVRCPSSVCPSSTMLKDLLLRNRWSHQSQILCGASLGRGNDILFAASGSHDQDGRHAHIW